MSDGVSANGSKCAYEYTVRRGDSFYLIAHRLGVPLRDLLEANSDINPARLMVGDVLCVPYEESDQHVPQSGTAVTGIAADDSTADGGAAMMDQPAVQGARSVGETSAGSGTPAVAERTATVAPDITDSASSGSTAGSEMTEAGKLPDMADKSGAAASEYTTDGTTMGGTAAHGTTAARAAADTGGTANTGTSSSDKVMDSAIFVCPESNRVTLTAGQTISDIQLARGLNLNSLQQVNPNVDLAAVGAGQTICVPEVNRPCTLPSTYVMTAGETLESIALKFNVPVASLLRANPCMAPADFEECAIVVIPR